MERKAFFFAQETCPSVNRVTQDGILATSAREFHDLMCVEKAKIIKILACINYSLQGLDLRDSIVEAFG